MRIFALDRSFYKLYRQDIVQLGPKASERLRIVQGFERHVVAAFAYCTPLSTTD